MDDDSNPFRSSKYESRGPSSNVNATSYDFYPSSTQYNQATAPSGSLGGAQSPPIPHFGFPENFETQNVPLPPEDDAAIKAIEGAKTVMAHPVWTWKFWQSFFDVDTSEVLRRMFLSFVPYPKYLKSESVEAFIGAKPDLYGPFWIGSTLVFIIAVLGNIASYFHNRGENFSWEYDFKTVSAAAITVFVYIWVVPLILWTVLWWMKMHGNLKLSGALCLYGYSMCIYIPVSFLWLINNVYVQWVSALTAATLSGIILAYVFWNHLHYTHSASAIIVGLLVFAGHLALSFSFMEVFFRYPEMASIYNGTTTISPAGLEVNLTHFSNTSTPDKPVAVSLTLTTSQPTTVSLISNATEIGQQLNNTLSLVVTTLSSLIASNSSQHSLQPEMG
ncbi:protein YIPF1-like [Paramacrobiotus metropolitanus]|uniref:protein YIPF1-like n=1 Tax=Paramacrobiotus metropolitanus TaxID=2943436 RepID=UPI002445E7D3|nr:protein YIPF1-like [Paramacrobiotus metropolitanus]